MTEELFNLARHLDKFHDGICALMQSSDCQTLGEMMDYIMGAFSAITPDYVKELSAWHDDLVGTIPFEEFWSKYYENEEKGF